MNVFSHVADVKCELEGDVGAKDPSDLRLAGAYMETEQCGMSKHAVVGVLCPVKAKMLLLQNRVENQAKPQELHSGCAALALRLCISTQCLH